MDNNGQDDQNTSYDKLANHGCSLMDCDIEWNTLSLDEWNKRFQRLPYSTLSQSYNYARAYCTQNNLTARWGVIKIGGQEEGVVQILEASILNKLIHAVILDRGPLWFDNSLNVNKIEAFWNALNKQFPRRIGRRIRVIPEIEKTAQCIDLFEKFHNLQRGASYQTINLDLSLSMDEIIRGFKSKWRNQYRKAERQDLDFYVDYEGKTLASFLINYRADQAFKDYKNLPVKQIPKFFKCFAETKECFLAHVQQDKKILASALVFLHGRTATWQIGWLSPRGRDVCANHLLLVKIMEILKERGISVFDLGGVNDHDAAGVKHFKEGMGGKLHALCGVYT